MTALIQLNLKDILELNDRQFLDICQTNQKYKFERNAEGELLIISQPDSQTQQWIWAIASQLWTWNQQTELGITFDNLNAFKFPNSAIRSPNLAWINSQRCSNLPREQSESIIPLSPDFVLELLSANDTWETLQLKMKEYQTQGVRLGWSIDPILKKIEIYTASHTLAPPNLPDSLSGETVLPGFLLDLKTIFH